MNKDEMGSLVQGVFKVKNFLLTIPTALSFSLSLSLSLKLTSTFQSLVYENDMKSLHTNGTI